MVFEARSYIEGQQVAIGDNRCSLKMNQSFSFWKAMATKIVSVLQTFSQTLCYLKNYIASTYLTIRHAHIMPE